MLQAAGQGAGEVPGRSERTGVEGGEGGETSPAAGQRGGERNPNRCRAPGRLDPAGGPGADGPVPAGPARPPDGARAAGRWEVSLQPHPLSGRNTVARVPVKAGKTA